MNNEYVIMFKRGAFDLGTCIVPVAIKYNKVFVDAFWNSKKQTFIQHLYTLMTSWAVVADIWYMVGSSRRNFSFFTKKKEEEEEERRRKEEWRAGANKNVQINLQKKKKKKEGGGMVMNHPRHVCVWFLKRFFRSCPSIIFGFFVFFFAFFCFFCVFFLFFFFLPCCCVLAGS